ncbi:MAG: aspartate-semialdehyde dehydrogenase [Dehalococcoidia bacterium]|jgi:aspartate-semialdehyde dehydrogenase|nr:aspartate-semialdehyde dehydrogenase [Chloroflexota bacterium]|tara:strand:+ start:23750 stop:24766 length:1017 start_codon:yes stop_codon:yes gene_type:complete
MLKKYNIAVIGATGAVGQVLLDLIEARNFPYNSLYLCASTRSVGKKLVVNETEYLVEEIKEELFNNVDFVFISANNEISKNIGLLASKKNCIVIDDSSVFRMNPDVPLVVPEVNAHALKEHKGIISIPNCSTTPLAMILKPLHSINPIKRVIVDTYQSVSGTGAAAIKELNLQSSEILDNLNPTISEYPHQIAFNLIPHIDNFHENGYTNEEMKMINETRKILEIPDLPISATCVRVPVKIAHCESVNIELSEPIELETVNNIFSNNKGIKILDNPLKNLYPTPIEVEGKDDVLIGRIRKDLSNKNGISLWLASDNLRKGAALNAIQIAEEIISNNYF